MEDGAKRLRGHREPPGQHRSRQRLQERPDPIKEVMRTRHDLRSNPTSKSSKQSNEDVRRRPQPSASTRGNCQAGAPGLRGLGADDHGSGSTEGRRDSDRPGRDSYPYDARIVGFRLCPRFRLCPLGGSRSPISSSPSAVSPGHPVAIWSRFGARFWSSRDRGIALGPS